MTIQTELKEFTAYSRLLYESDNFACGFFEAAISEMFKLIPESEQEIFTRVIARQKEKIVSEAKYRGLM